MRSYYGDALPSQEVMALNRLMRGNSSGADRGCFAQGTLVWTDKGQVPIEKLKPGDMVLSQPEQTGERRYKRIVNTFVFDGKDIWHLSYYNPETGRINQIYATGNHPFWLKDFGWIDLENIEPGSRLELADGVETFVYKIETLYRTIEENVAFVTSSVSDKHRGFLVDLDDNFRVASDGIDEELGMFAQYDQPFVRRRVFNIEVEDFHTYYVGDEGVWVRGRNCAGATGRGM